MHVSHRGKEEKAHFLKFLKAAVSSNSPLISNGYGSPFTRVKGFISRKLKSRSTDGKTKQISCEQRQCSKEASPTKHQQRHTQPHTFAHVCTCTHAQLEDDIVLISLYFMRKTYKSNYILSIKDDNKSNYIQKNPYIILIYKVSECKQYLTHSSMFS